MRLINTHTGEFVEFTDVEQVPPYAILSHTWEKGGEQTYQQVLKIQEWRPQPENDSSNSRSDGDPGPVRKIPTSSGDLITSEPNSAQSTSLGPSARGSEMEAHAEGHGRHTPSTSLHPIWDAKSRLSEKIRRACEIARRDGYRYIWIDSCCINKESSSELSEAINSMFDWYRAAQVCYAFLADVPYPTDVREDGEFSNSRWFKRGWTLQELIAPHSVVFLSQNWEGLGTKHGLADVIHSITSIDRRILTHERALSDESVANRMRWASRRETTRVEDEAYSLLGIFGITMTTLYGEGQYAFRRLQEEILRQIPDQSIFAWGSQLIQSFHRTENVIRASVMVEDTPKTLFAPSPQSFRSYNRDKPIILPKKNLIQSLGLPVEEYTHTPYGIRTQFCVFPLQDLNPDFQISLFDSRRRKLKHIIWYLLVLRSQEANDDQQSLLTRLCFLRGSDRDNIELLCLPTSIIHPFRAQSDSIGPFTVSLRDLKRVKLQSKTVYLPHSPSVAAQRLLFSDQRLYSPDTTVKLRLKLPTWATAALRLIGYTISNVQDRTQEQESKSFSFDLSHSTELNIHIQYRYSVLGNKIYTPIDRKDYNIPMAIAIEARVWILSPSEEGLCTDTAIIELSPPHNSTAWGIACTANRWPMALPARSLGLIADSGEQVMLWLRLDLTALYEYNVCVNVARTAEAQLGPVFYPHLKDLPWPRSLNSMGFYLPPKTLNLILLGSSRRTLELKGYSIDLALHPDLTSVGGCQSLTLSTRTSSDEFVIVVKYFKELNPDGESNRALIVARITLESSASGDGSETVQDGPHVVSWDAKGAPWAWILEQKHVILKTQYGNSFMLHIGLDLAWYSEYYLYLDIDPHPLAPKSQPSQPSQPWTTGFSQSDLVQYPYLINLRPYDQVNLVLPAHVKRTLEAQGYQVSVEGSYRGQQPDDLTRHLLTLSLICANAGVIIVVDYSYRLVTHEPELDSDSPTDKLIDEYPFLLEDPQLDSDSDLVHAPTAKASLERCQQELTFQAFVQSLPFSSIPGDTPNRIAFRDDITATTVNWNAKDPADRFCNLWRRYVDREDITLTVPTGRKLVLHLGFYLVWYSEYCLIVEVDDGTPLSRFDEPMPNDEQGEAGMEVIWQLLQIPTSLSIPADPGMMIAPESSTVSWTRTGGGEEDGLDSSSDSDQMVGINPQVHLPRTPSRGHLPPMAGSKFDEAGMTGPESSAKEARDEMESLSGSGFAGEILRGGAAAAAPAKVEEHDDIGLFGSDDNNDTEAERIKAERVAAYNAKKAGEPKTVVKSIATLEVKPPDDETEPLRQPLAQSIGSGQSAEADEEPARADRANHDSSLARRHRCRRWWRKLRSKIVSAFRFGG